MVYYGSFQDYLRVYEATLTDYLNSLNVSIEEFYEDVRAAKEETDDPYLLTFIDCLLASADYESFYKVMVREGKKSKAKRVEVDHRAEAKLSPTRHGHEGKGFPNSPSKEVPADSKADFK